MNAIVVFSKITDEYIGIAYVADDMNVDEAACCDIHFKYKAVIMGPETEVWQGNLPIVP